MQKATEKKWTYDELSGLPQSASKQNRNPSCEGMSALPIPGRGGHHIIRNNSGMAPGWTCTKELTAAAAAKSLQ